MYNKNLTEADYIKATLIGKRYGMLVVKSEKITIIKIGLNNRKNRRYYVEAVCDCGKSKTVLYDSLVRRKTISCGCFFKGMKGEKSPSFKKGYGNLREYRIYYLMLYRCYNPKCKNFDRYGGRGIRVCDRWVESFDNFLKDMGLSPTNNHSLDRYPDLNGNYSPDNCRWATHKEQANNKGNCVVINIGGINKNLEEWCNIFNIEQSKAHHRLNKLGWSVEETFNIKKRDNERNIIRDTKGRFIKNEEGTLLI